MTSLTYQLNSADKNKPLSPTELSTFSKLSDAVTAAITTARRIQLPVIITVPGQSIKPIQIPVTPHDPNAFLPISFGLITDIRYMTEAEELHACGADDQELGSDASYLTQWTNTPNVFTFENGSILYALADEEGNDGGTLWTPKSPIHPDDNAKHTIIGSFIASIAGNFDTLRICLQNLTTGKSTVVLAMRDPEGNGPGIVVVNQADGKQFYL